MSIFRKKRKSAKKLTFLENGMKECALHAYDHLICLNHLVTDTRSLTLAILKRVCFMFIIISCEYAWAYTQLENSVCCLYFVFLSFFRSFVCLFFSLNLSISYLISFSVMYIHQSITFTSYTGFRKQYNVDIC